MSAPGAPPLQPREKWLRVVVSVRGLNASEFCVIVAVFNRVGETNDGVELTGPRLGSEIPIGAARASRALRTLTERGLLQRDGLAYWMAYAGEAL
ncbi:hypothetical protein [Tsukamurella paurometabola]|uniref:PaaX family transcriptional regulator n=1 Tax=Tsukamurella paurometabola TaxID=2061 RepID=A0ABS5NID8_TSUPA|nr:hypothetical protein [Tsukamurella paurometabola]MBS4104019.1 hypothetical protein [Tsukamurella paurometabola]